MQKKLFRCLVFLLVMFGATFALASNVIRTAEGGLAKKPVDNTDNQPSSLGNVWHTTEAGGWTGTWTRRGDTFVFDAVWVNGGQRVTGVFTMIVEGRTIRFQSRQQSNGHDVDYEGTLSSDGGSARGTLRLVPGGTAAGWEAKIEYQSASSGNVWHTTEAGGWTGTWTCRGDTSVFDAVWVNGGQRVTGVFTMIVEGRAIRIQSRQQSNGHDVDYEGTLSADGRSAKGTLRLLPSGSAVGWEASIEYQSLSLGKIWHTTEAGGWTGTWTRRGDSLVFDAVWTNGSQRVTGVFTMTVEGRTIRFQSRQQSNKHDVDYVGTLSTDGRSAQGTLRLLPSGSSVSWEATIVF